MRISDWSSDVCSSDLFAGERKLAKPGEAVADDQPLEVRGQDHPWVSRGGLKLAHAIEHFGLDPAGRICLDLGASTGGFTDVLLQSGDRKSTRLNSSH